MTREDLRIENAELRQRLAEVMALHRVHVFKSMHIQPAEARLLNALYEANGPVPSKDLLEAARADRAKPIKPQATTVYICRIRAMMGAGAIETVPGKGYRLTQDGRAELDDLLGLQVAA